MRSHVIYRTVHSLVGAGRQYSPDARKADDESHEQIARGIPSAPSTWRCRRDVIRHGRRCFPCGYLVWRGKGNGVFESLCVGRVRPVDMDQRGSD